MGAYYDEIEIEDMAWDEEKGVFHYPCPCGDRFEISRKQLANYEDIATCPSCSLIIRVIYDPVRGLSVCSLEQILIACPVFLAGL
jgi:diphthamide biosynthesis protein 3